MTISENAVALDAADTPTTGQPGGSASFDRAFLIPCTWLMLGITLDGWAHNHIPALETFFTPWHAVLYSGYLATALFLLVVLVRSHRRGFAWQQAVPVGYGLSLLGAAIFGVAGMLDLIWHALFGIEKNVEALLSPTHLMLALGAVLILSGPFRATWQRLPANRTVRKQDFFPMLLSIAYVLAIFTFFTQFANPIAHSYADKHTIEPLEDLGIASILLQTTLFMGTALFIIRRWSLPAGAFTLIYMIISVVSSLMAASSPVVAVAILAALTGLLIDGVNKGLKPSVARISSLRLFAFVTPVIINGIYFLGLAIFKGFAWSIHLWMGSIAISAIIGLLLSYVLVQPPLPPGQEQS